MGTILGDVISLAKQQKSPFLPLLGVPVCVPIMISQVRGEQSFCLERQGSQKADGQPQGENEVTVRPTGNRYLKKVETVGSATKLTWITDAVKPAEIATIGGKHPVDQPVTFEQSEVLHEVAVYFALRGAFMAADKMLSDEEVGQGRSGLGMTACHPARRFHRSSGLDGSGPRLPKAG